MIRIGTLTVRSFTQTDDFENSLDGPKLWCKCILKKFRLMIREGTDLCIIFSNKNMYPAHSFKHFPSSFFILIVTYSFIKFYDFQFHFTIEKNWPNYLFHIYFVANVFANMRSFPRSSIYLLYKSLNSIKDSKRKAILSYSLNLLFILWIFERTRLNILTVVRSIYHWVAVWEPPGGIKLDRLSHCSLRSDGDTDWSFFTGYIQFCINFFFLICKVSVLLFIEQ